LWFIRAFSTIEGDRRSGRADRPQGTVRTKKAEDRVGREPAIAPPKAMLPKQRQLRLSVEALLRGGDGRIIAGPWLGEVGWEVLYWIPLLRWCVCCWPELHDRLVVVSRGGVAGWYEGIAASYVDLGEHYDGATFARLVDAERASRKARGLKSNAAYEETAWEREIGRWVSERLDEGDMPMLHPSILFRSRKLLLWLSELEDVSFTRLRRPALNHLEAVLPESYIAVRFYLSVLSDGAVENGFAEFAEAAISSLAEKVPVVVLNPGMDLDHEHPDLIVEGPNVIPLAPHMSFRTNLAVQSAAIAHATAFVGTYGGLSYVPSQYGVPSISFWSKDRLPPTKTDAFNDLALANRVFNRAGWGRFIARPFDDASLEELLAPALAR
jgi:hypothetical protein